MTTLFALEKRAAHEASALHRIPFTRLVRVEWAKATDTRAARLLLALVGLATTLIVLVAVLKPSSFDQTYKSYLEVASMPQVILLPLVAILMFTGEWSQRSIMTTFTQEPQRLRVVYAKLSVSLMLGCGSAIFGGAITAAGIALARASGRTLEGSLSIGDIAGYFVYIVLNALGGVAVGALLQNSAAAIGAYFVLNPAAALLGEVSKPVNDWIDTETIWTWILHNEWTGHVPQILFSMALWVGVPLAAGVVRTLRRDVG
jgi:ABC-2 type transport system permease protein